MPGERPPDLSLFLDVLRILEAIDAPYMGIGAFAAIIYGSTRTTYDIDIVVDLAEEHVQALVDAYPPPRFYADPQQSAAFDETYLDTQAGTLGVEVAALWESIKDAARRGADQSGV